MSNLEGFGEKLIRHIREGAFDVASLVSGANQFYELVGRKFGGLHLESTKSSSDHMGVKGLDVKDLLFTKPAFPALRRRIRMVDLPIDFKARCVVDESDITTLAATTRENFVNPNTIFSFTGPTFLHGYPNNGFYKSEHGLVVPFGAAPRGQTRGAIAVSRKGFLHILDDDAKFKLLASNQLNDFDAIVGCSNFMSFDSSTDADELVEELALSPMSYLGYYTLQDGSQRLSYFVTTASMSRDEVQHFLMTHMAELDASRGNFVELELKHAGATILGDDIDHFGGVFKSRNDYWFIDKA